jgi:pimeloyl-ACP methyl ester carboxylesterase
MPCLQTNSVRLCYRQTGARANPTVLLVHGWNCQLIHWPESLVESLAAAGYRVVAFDNRDVGRSSYLHDADVGTLEHALKNGRRLDAAYQIADLARDAIGVLDHLGQSGAHVIGFSLGGMIAQQMALSWPDRVFSLTSIASSTSDRDLPGGERAAFEAFASTPPADRRAAIAHLAKGWKVAGGPHFDSTLVGLGRFAETAYDRGYDPHAAARQLLTILQAEPRGEALKALEVPALVLHGNADPLVPAAAGERTAASLKNARLVTYDLLGHDLPEPLIGAMADEVVRHLDSVPSRR